jgi:hypothetical protein
MLHLYLVTLEESKFHFLASEMRLSVSCSWEQKAWSEYRERVRKVQNETKQRSGGSHQKCREMKWSGVKWSNGSKLWGGEGYVVCGDVQWREGHDECESSTSWRYAFHYCCSSVDNMFNFASILAFIYCICIVFLWVTCPSLFAKSRVLCFVWASCAFCVIWVIYLFLVSCSTASV